MGKAEKVTFEQRHEEKRNKPYRCLEEEYSRKKCKNFEAETYL